VRIFLATGSTDLRKSFDALAQLSRDVLEEDPLSGHLFVFCNRRRNRLKILLWESSGFWLLCKRLEKGCFYWPQTSEQKVELSAAQLSLLLAGIDLKITRQRAWYARDVQESCG
jgi:transposase